MDANKTRIHYTVVSPQEIASFRCKISTRKEIFEKIQGMLKTIPDRFIAGSPFCIFYYVSSVKEGLDVEIGIHVTKKFPSKTLKFRKLPKMEIFSILHKGKYEEINLAYNKVFQYAYQFGFPSQEFSREIYKHIGQDQNHEIEVQFIIHPWNKLLVDNLIRVLGVEQQQKIMEGFQALEIESSLEKKFEWLVGMLKRLEQVADEQQQYEILSSCAHFFPEEMIAELKQVYEEARKNSPSMVETVDKLLEFMQKIPGWGSVPIRDGNILYTTKSPRDPKGFENAKTRLEKKKAYCFCPMIRDFLDKDIPATFCNCGTGWVRQQWEGVFGQPLKIEIVKSLTKGDEECQFAIHLPA